MRGRPGVGAARRTGLRGGGGGAPLSAPTIVIAGTVKHGETLTATHNGASVQWYAGDVAIPGATADTYAIDVLAKWVGGSPIPWLIGPSITCKATNAAGTTTSNALAFSTTDVDLVGAWFPEDLTDNGTTATIVAELGSGSFTSTGASRATLSATGMDDNPGIVMNGAILSTAAIGTALSGKTGCTILQVVQATAATSAYLHRYGTTADGDFRALRSQPGAGRVTQTLEATANVVWTGEAGLNAHLKYVTCLAHRYDTTAAAVPLRSDGRALPGASTGTPNSATFGARTFYWGSESNGTSPFPGFLGPLAVFGRVLSDADAITWSAYLTYRAGATAKKTVMWNGDSITANNSATYAQWREAAQDEQDADIAADGGRFYAPIGNFSVADPTFDLDYGMAGGGNTVAILDGYLATYNVDERYPADIVMILIGTNDIAISGLTPAQLATALAAYIVNLRAAIPHALIVVQKLLPRGDADNTDVQDFNDNHIAGVVAGAGTNVILDDTLATLPGITYVDAVHPDVASGPAMGAAMYARVRALAGL